MVVIVGVGLHTGGDYSGVTEIRQTVFFGAGAWEAPLPWLVIV